MKPHEIYKKALEYWGEEFQLDMVIEECLELCHAIFKFKRGRTTIEDVAEEGVDVYIMLGQLQQIVHKKDIRIPSLWFTKYNEKMERLKKLINKEK